MPLIPPQVPVNVFVDGRRLAVYQRAYIAGGRVFVPVAPLLTRLSERIWFDDATLLLERAGRTVRIRIAPALPAPLNSTFVPAGPVLRALGASVRYQPHGHLLMVSTSGHAPVTSPTPFNPALPSAAPVEVFTPVPPVTPRPVWSGSPLPRRTALPFPPP